MSNVPENLRRLRIWRGLSQRDLGRCLGLDGQVAITTISRMERGEVTPSLERLHRLADALDVSAATLLK